MNVVIAVPKLLVNGFTTLLTGLTWSRMEYRKGFGLVMNYNDEGGGEKKKENHEELKSK
jgi:hypothetical protein